MKSGSASGLQIAFFTFAVVLLAAPVSKWVLAAQPWSPDVGGMLGKSIPFLMGGAVLLAFPGLRRLCVGELARSVSRDKRLEVALVAGVHLLTAFAWAGAVALWYWSAGGEQGLEARIRRLASHESEMRRAFLDAELVRSFVVVGILAPLAEEIVFRGLLYRGWERQWGWIPAMLLTSVLFGVYHANFSPAFVGSVIYVCLLRRTGSLWAPIIAHSAFNVLSWYPLVGRHVFPRDLIAPGDLSSWSFHLACLLITAIALPAYVWMARKREPEAFPATRSHGALPQ